MSNHTLPTLGAALPAAALAEHRDWLVADQRDLEIQDTFNPDVLDGDWRPMVRQIRDVLDGHRGRLGIHGPFDGLTIMSRDRRVRELVADRLRQGLEVAGELGATHMVVHSPFIFFGSPFLPHSCGFEQAKQLELIHLALDPVVVMASDVGCALVIEDIQDKHPGPWLALIRSFNSQYVRASIDVGHAFVQHSVGGPPPDLWVREADGLLEHLHLQDSDGNYDRHWAPGDGAINWFALFQALATLAHQPRLIIETRDKSDVRRGAAWLAERGLAR